MCKGESRGFAFVKFFAVDAAQVYMAQHYPVVHMGENSKVKIAYSLGRGEEDNGWTCQQVDIFLFCLEIGSIVLCLVFTGQFPETRSLLSMFISPEWYGLPPSVVLCRGCVY